ncbi:MAG: glycosyltransferase, partial [Flammeovirgaceae bacterium]|nr:glycosyltransferase [Flammeovirgaceae bacterium]
VLIVAIYLLLLGVLYAIWKTHPIFQPTPSNAKTLISVVVPVRNEATTIALLLERLAVQSFRTFEVVIIDDHSNDQTVAIVENLRRTLSYRIELLSLPDERVGCAPKKAAITLGVQHANGELIVTTDGDCLPEAEWLQTIHDFYQQTGAQLISAPVHMSPQTKWIGEQLQEIEFALLVGIGGATMLAGFPTMCSGANLTFTKTAFLAVNGYKGFDHLASGDDEFLMHKIYRMFPEKVRYLKSPKALVRTLPQPTFKTFLQQRKRWAGKWRAYKHLPSIFLGVGGVVAHVALLLLALIGYLTTNLHWWGILVAIKVVIEFLFTSEMMSFLKAKKKRPFLVLLMAILSPFYVLLIAFLANLNSYVWKGRKMT